MKVAGVDAGVEEAGAARSKPGGRLGGIRYLAAQSFTSSVL
jgi:hypothetical protein